MPERHLIEQFDNTEGSYYFSTYLCSTAVYYGLSYKSGLLRQGGRVDK